MKLQDQVCTEQQAKRLNELGVMQNGYYCYAHREINSKPAFNGEITEYESEYSDTPDVVETGVAVWDGLPFACAFTVAELGAMIGRGTNAAALFYDAVRDQMNRSHSFTIALNVQFVANCVIGILETGRLTIDEVNKRLCTDQQ